MTTELLCNPKYTFENFVVGACNKQAYINALAAATTMPKVPNPLVIYGKMGHGKTHLLHAIAQYIVEKSPEKRAVYTTGESFLNDIVESLIATQDDKDAYLKFEEKYKEADVLLVDDIEMIMKQKVARDIFFEVTQVLQTSKKKLIFTSENHPKELPTFNHRWVLYLQQGEIIELKELDFDTRYDILQSKITQNNFERCELSTEVLDYIARRARENVRVLEGTLNKVIAKYYLTGADTIDVAFVKKVLE